MPNKYFSNHYYTAIEFNTIEDLYNEAIYNQGFTAYYIPAHNFIIDLLWGEDNYRKYEKAYPLDAYLVNSNYGEQNDFFSKFGLEIRNECNIEITTREFFKKVPNYYKRPREGDLIYIPFMRNNGQLFEIKFTNTSTDLNVLTRTEPFVYTLSLVPVKYNNEEIKTGNTQIDDIDRDNAHFITLNLGTGSGTFILDELVYQGSSNTNYTAIGSVSYYDANTKVLEVIHTIGTFAINQTLIGDSSNSHYILISDNTRFANTEFDNNVIHTESLSALKLPEDNPFGGLAEYQG